MRVPSFVSGPNIKPGVLDRMSIMHIMDWTATLVDFAGGQWSNNGFDGMSFKEPISDKILSCIIIADWTAQKSSLF